MKPANKKKGISSYLRTDPRVHAAILRALATHSLTQKDLIDIAAKCGVQIYAPKLSTYLKHGGNAENSLTDESILLICGILGIDIQTKIETHGLQADKIREFFKKFFPASKFPKYKNTPERLIKHYRITGSIMR